MPDIRTFRASSMQEALDLVRHELGSDAVILNTKQVERKRGLLWGRRRSEVEITAGLDVNVPARAAAVARRPSFPPTAAPTTPQRTSAADILAAMEQQGTLDGLAAEFQRTTRIDPAHEVGDGRVGSAHREAPSASNGTSAMGTAHPTNDLHPLSDGFTDKLDRITRMLESLGRTSRTAGSDDVPEELFHVYTDLIEADVEDDLARELVESLRAECSPEQLRDTDGVRDRLTRLVEGRLNVGGPIHTGTGRRRVVALVGPTGVGKTTTIAKLAANFRLRDGVRMGLVTVDTYRIAAVEQLRTYAEIIDLPMKVVTSPQEMRRALDELSGLDLVLIDTAGRSPRDDLRIQELKSLLAEAHCDEVHLVLSLTAGLRNLETTAERFRSAGVTSMILTKLDEAAGPGAVYSLARKVDLPVSYLTTGQDVPDDIEAARVDRMARLVLGRERVAT